MKQFYDLIGKSYKETNYVSSKTHTHTHTTYPFPGLIKRGGFKLLLGE